MKRLVLLVAVGVTVMSAGAAGWLWLRPPNQERALARIQQNPGMYGVESRAIRVCPLHRFPYAVYYEELSDRLWVAAVGHQSRRPGYWSRRRPS